MACLCTHWKMTTTTKLISISVKGLTLSPVVRKRVSRLLASFECRILSLLPSHWTAGSQNSELSLFPLTDLSPVHVPCLFVTTSHVRDSSDPASGPILEDSNEIRGGSGTGTVKELGKDKDLAVFLIDVTRTGQSLKSCPFHSCDKGHDQKQPGKERVYVACLREVKAETLDCKQPRGGH